MRNELHELLYFLKSSYIWDPTTICTTNPIDPKTLELYANTVEKLLKGDIILIDRSKLEKAFQNKEYNYSYNYCDSIWTFRKEFRAITEISVDSVKYNLCKNKKELKKHIDEALTYNLTNYFIDNFKVTEENNDVHKDN